MGDTFATPEVLKEVVQLAYYSIGARGTVYGFVNQVVDLLQQTLAADTKYGALSGRKKEDWARLVRSRWIVHLLRKIKAVVHLTLSRICWCCLQLVKTFLLCSHLAVCYLVPIKLPLCIDLAEMCLLFQQQLLLLFSCEVYTSEDQCVVLLAAPAQVCLDIYTNIPLFPGKVWPRQSV